MEKTALSPPETTLLVDGRLQGANMGVLLCSKYVDTYVQNFPKHTAAHVAKK